MEKFKVGKAGKSEKSAEVNLTKEPPSELSAEEVVCHLPPVVTLLCILCIRICLILFAHWFFNISLFDYLAVKTVW